MAGAVILDHNYREIRRLLRIVAVVGTLREAIEVRARDGIVRTARANRPRQARNNRPPFFLRLSGRSVHRNHGLCRRLSVIAVKYLARWQEQEAPLERGIILRVLRIA